MSERIYTWLLRLFPSHFRQAYGEEALKLFRDRARNETGFLLRLRLWMDLLVDVAKSLPREYRYAQGNVLQASTQRAFDAAPGFYMLRTELPRPGALLGGVVWVVVLVTFSILFDPFGSSSAAWVRSAEAQTGSQLSQSQSPDSKTTSSTPGNSNLLRATWKLDAAEKRRVIEGAVSNLRKHYFDPELGREMSDSLLAHEKRGDDEAVTEGDTFAGLLTRQMRDVSHDVHLELVYSRMPLPQESGEPTPEALARYRQVLQKQNCGFEQVKIFPNNVGYLKLNAFPEPSVCEPIAKEAMSRLNNGSALIFDLRDNRGGEPRMVALMAAYLFDHPEYFYNPRENLSRESWTSSPVPQNKLADKPVYILTSSRTISGAEQFCYNMKMLKRATLVGERTGGAAHAGVFYRIDDHFGIGVPEVKPINPYSDTDWEEVGVEPDIKVAAVDALAAAEKLAQKKLSRK